MKLETARKLVAKKLAGFEVQAAPPLDAARRAARPAVEIISPSLQTLKRRYFGDHASPTPPVLADSEDSGIVMVKREKAKAASAKAVVFRKGKIVGRQG